MIKATLLYGHPTDPVAFKKYYAETHLLIAATMKGVDKLELAKFLSTAYGSKAANYRMAELFFSGPEKMQETMSSP